MELIFALKCNALKCRQRLADEALVTTCGWVREPKLFAFVAHFRGRECITTTPTDQNQTYILLEVRRETQHSSPGVGNPRSMSRLSVGSTKQR